MAPAQKESGGVATASKSLKQSGSFLVRVSVEAGADGESEVRFFVRNLGDGREERLRDPEQLPERLLDQLNPLGRSDAPMPANLEAAQSTDPV